MKTKEKNNTKLIVMIAVAIIFVIQLCVPFLIIVSNAGDKAEQYTEQGYVGIEFKEENMIKAIIWNLENKEIIRDGLYLYIKTENLNNVTSLDLSNWKLTNITGIEKFVAVTTVDLSINNVQDITALGNLSNLTTLNLSNNNVQNITALGNLSNLTILNLSNNKIQDISSLTNTYTTLNVANQKIEFIATETAKNEDWIRIELPQIFSDERVRANSNYKSRYYAYTFVREECEKIIMPASNAGDLNGTVDIEGGIATGTTCRFTYKVFNIKVNSNKIPSTLTGDNVDIEITIKGRNNNITEIKFLEGNHSEVTDFEGEENILQEDTENYIYKYTRTENGVDSIYVKDVQGEERIEQIETTNKVAYIEYEELQDGIEATINFIEDGNTYEVTNNGGSRKYKFADSTYFVFEFKNTSTEEIGTARAEISNVRISFLDEKMYLAVKEELEEQEIDFLDLGYRTIDNNYVVLMSEDNKELVKKLNLSAKGISNISGIENFTELEEVYLEKNTSMGDLNTTLWRLENLKIISLGTIGSETIDGEKFNYSKLEKLQVSCNTVKNILKGFEIYGTITTVNNIGTETQPVTLLDDTKFVNVDTVYVKGNISAKIVNNVTVTNGDIITPILEYLTEYYVGGTITNSSANKITGEKITNCTADVIEGGIIKNNIVGEKIIVRATQEATKYNGNAVTKSEILNNKNKEDHNYNIEIKGMTLLEFQRFYMNIENGAKVIGYDIKNDCATNIIFNGYYKQYVNQYAGIETLTISSMKNLETVNISIIDDEGIENDTINNYISLKINDANNLKSINANNNILNLANIELNNVANNTEGLSLDFTQTKLVCMNEYFDYESLSGKVIKGCGANIVDTNVKKLVLNTDNRTKIESGYLPSYVLEECYIRLCNTKWNLDRGIEPKQASILQSQYNPNIAAVDMYGLGDYMSFEKLDSNYYGYDYACNFTDFLRSLPNLEELVLKGTVSELNLDMSLRSRLEKYETYNCDLPKLKIIDLTEVDNLEKLNIKGLEGLEEVKLNNGTIGQINMSNLPKLSKLELGNILGIKSLELAEIPLLESIDIRNSTEIEALKVADLENLVDVKANVMDICDLELINLPLLENVNLYNLLYDSEEADREGIWNEHIINSVNIENCPKLYICILINQIDELNINNVRKVDIGGYYFPENDSFFEITCLEKLESGTIRNIEELFILSGLMESKDLKIENIQKYAYGTIYLKGEMNTLYIKNANVRLNLAELSKLNTLVISNRSMEETFDDSEDLNLSNTKIKKIIIDSKLSWWGLTSSPVIIDISNSSINYIKSMEDGIDYLNEENIENLQNGMYINLENSELLNYLDETKQESWFRCGLIIKANITDIKDIELTNNSDKNIYFTIYRDSGNYDTIENLKLKNVNVNFSRYDYKNVILDNSLSYLGTTIIENGYAEKNDNIIDVENLTIKNGDYTEECAINVENSANISVENCTGAEIHGRETHSTGKITLAENPELKKLIINGYELETEDILKIKDYSKLEYLNLDGYIGYDYSNKIEDITVIDEMYDLGALKEVSLKKQFFFKYFNEQISNKKYEIELPQIIKMAKDEESVAYTSEGYTLYNCTLSEDGTKIILNTSNSRRYTASIKINGGIADNTELWVDYNVKPIVIESIIQTPTDLTDKDITVQTTAYVTGELTKFKYLEGEKQASDFAEAGEDIGYTAENGKYIGTFNVEKNGKYTIYILNSEGHEEVKVIEINNKVANITYNTTTEGKIKATISLSDEKYVVTNNEGSKEYIFTGKELNGEFNFIISDSTDITKTGSITAQIGNKTKEIALEENLYNQVKTIMYNKGITFEAEDEQKAIRITYDELKKITELDISSKNITTLKGIEAFTYLSTLNASNNNIGVIGPEIKTFLDSVENVNLENQVLTQEIVDAIEKETEYTIDMPNIMTYYGSSWNLSNCTKIVGEGKITIDTNELSQEKTATIEITTGKAKGTKLSIKYKVIPVPDLTSPNIIITYNTNATTKDNIIVMIISNEPIQNNVIITEGENSTEETWSYIPLTEKKIITKQYTKNTDTKQKITVKDLTGNETIGEIEVTWINKEIPEIQIEVENINEITKTKKVAIKAIGDISKLNTENEYKYCMSSSEELSGSEEWKDYTLGEEFVIGENLTGEYYLHIKEIKNNLDSVSPVKKSNEMKFDNKEPKIIIDGTAISEGKYNKVTAKIEDENNYEVLLTKNKTKISFVNGMEISQIGKYEITVTDIAGNVSKTNFEIAEYITFGKYTVYEENEKMYLTEVSPTTTLEMFTINLETNLEGIKVKKQDNELLQNGQYVGTGMTLELNGVRYTIVVKGDSYKGDGIVNTFDLLAMFYHKVYAEKGEENEYKLNEEKLKAADINKNGKVDSVDLLKVFYHKEKIEGYSL